MQAAAGYAGAGNGAGVDVEDLHAETGSHRQEMAAGTERERGQPGCAGGEIGYSEPAKVITGTDQSRQQSQRIN